MLTWIEVLGSLGVVLTVSYLVYRALRSRPTLSLTVRGERFLRIANPSNADIVISEVIFQPEVYAVSLSSSPNDVAAALVGSKLGCRIAPYTAVELPLFVRDAALEAEIKSSVRIIARWRKTKAPWSPQVPAGLWISTDAIRELQASPRQPAVRPSKLKSRRLSSHSS
jgi:hypothetical protein